MCAAHSLSKASVKYGSRYSNAGSWVSSTFLMVIVGQFGMRVTLGVNQRTPRFSRKLSQPYFVPRCRPPMIARRCPLVLNVKPSEPTLLDPGPVTIACAGIGLG